MSVPNDPAYQADAGAAASSSGLHAGMASWHPPVPSMAALPVDMSKTEPKPAYYKLQFGDDYTGFSYYVRTLGIVIGRKCEKPIQVPPPDIMSPQVPARPPLEIGVMDGEMMDVQNDRMDQGVMSRMIGTGMEEVSNDLFLGELQSGMEEGNMTMAESAGAGPFGLEVSHESVDGGSVTPEIKPQTVQAAEIDPGQISTMDGDLPQADGLHDVDAMQQALPTDPTTSYTNGAPNGEYDLDLDLDLDVASDAAIIHFMLNGSGPAEMDDSFPPPPPPPPTKSASSVEHVDVDLGPLKSVSRNHAKIDFRPDLGHFCLEIHGRNGAWVDDRYYVKGSAVPLYQGSVIQIATRIFSFILPPSPGGSPSTPHVLDASFDSNSPLDDVPYPYNLPASQLGYQEFFGESATATAGPGPATLSQQVPQPFNAFTAQDGQGLGLGMEYDWSQDKRKGRHHWTEEWSSEDSEDSWDSWDESDEVEERKIHRRRRRGRRMDEGESELSSVEDGSEEEEEEDDDDEDDSEDEGEEEEMEEEIVVAKVPESAKDDPMLDEVDKPKKRGRPKAPSVSQAPAATPSVVVKEEIDVPLAVNRPGKAPAQSGKLPSKSVKAVKALKAQAKSKQAAASGDVDMADASASVAEVTEAKKVKKVKAEVIGEAKAVEAPPKDKEKEKEKENVKEKEKDKEKPKPPPKKVGPKKVKAVPPPPPPKLPSVPGVLIPGLSVQVTPPPPRPAPPPPTLAAAMAAAAPPRPPQPRPPPPPGSIRPPPGTVRPPLPPHPNQPQVGQSVRPPIRPPIRPPGIAPGSLPNRPPLPPPPAVRPPGIRPPPPSAHPIPQPPNTPRPVPVHAVSASAQSTAASSPGGTPEPQKPFYLTELIETPGRPGHIIVNVPIPPSGAGPRPPPGPLIGLDGENFIGPPPIKPTATFAIIIYSALANLQRGRGTLGEVCNWIAGEWEWFRLNVDTGWQNSIRHNLSLNKAFLKVPRIPEDDPESKGSVWIIDPKEGPIFEEKQRKESHKSEGKTRTAEMRAVRERQKVDERTKMVKDGVIPPPLTPPLAPPVVTAPLARPPPQPRVSAPVIRPTPRPPAAVQIPKGPVLPKEKVAVSFDIITPAMRAESLIQTLDSNGNPLPFVCSPTALVLERSAFGHLTPDIIEKLHLLGAHVAVEVLLSWVNNKNKQQLLKAAQAKAASNAAASASASSRPAIRPNPASKQARPPVRPPATNTATARPPSIAPARPPPPSASGTHAASAARPPDNGPNTRPPPPSSAARPPPGPGQNTKAPIGGASKPAAGGPPKPGSSLGPAPPGATMTKIITMIATVAAANGDVKTVGQHAVALLRYIKMVGAAIDLKAAERIWATGIVPPFTKGGAGGGMGNGVKPNGAGVNGGVGGVKKVGGPGGAPGLSPGMAPKGPNQLRPSPGPSSAGGRTPTLPTQNLASTPAARTAPLPQPGTAVRPNPGMAGGPGAGGPMKRKLEEGEGGGQRQGQAGPSTVMASEAKRPKLEAGGS